MCIKIPYLIIAVIANGKTGLKFHIRHTVATRIFTTAFYLPLDYL